MGSYEKHKQPARSNAGGSSPFEAWLTTYRRVLEGLGKEKESSHLGPPGGEQVSFAASSQATAAKKPTHARTTRNT